MYTKSYIYYIVYGLTQIRAQKHRVLACVKCRDILVGSGCKDRVMGKGMDN